MQDDTKKVGELDLTPIDQELDIELLQKAQENGEEEEAFSCKLNTRRDERQLALYLLYALDRAEYSMDLHAVTNAFESGFDCTISNGSFAISLVKGVLDQKDALDELLTPFLKNWRLERLGCCTRLILHIALWELKQPDAISSIIINEAVELAKMFAEKDAYRFVNGILDEIAKHLAENAQQEQPESDD